MFTLATQALPGTLSGGETCTHCNLLIDNKGRVTDYASSEHTLSSLDEVAERDASGPVVDGMLVVGDTTDGNYKQVVMTGDGAAATDCGPGDCI